MWSTGPCAPAGTRKTPRLSVFNPLERSASTTCENLCGSKRDSSSGRTTSKPVADAGTFESPSSPMGVTSGVPAGGVGTMSSKCSSSSEPSFQFQCGVPAGMIDQVAGLHDVSCVAHPRVHRAAQHVVQLIAGMDVQSRGGAHSRRYACRKTQAAVEPRARVRQSLAVKGAGRESREVHRAYVLHGGEPL